MALSLIVTVQYLSLFLLYFNVVSELFSSNILLWFHAEVLKKQNNLHLHLILIGTYHFPQQISTFSCPQRWCTLLLKCTVWQWKAAIVGWKQCGIPRASIEMQCDKKDCVPNSPKCHTDMLNILDLSLMCNTKRKLKMHTICFPYRLVWPILSYYLYNLKQGSTQESIFP